MIEIIRIIINNRIKINMDDKNETNHQSSGFIKIAIYKKSMVGLLLHVDLHRLCDRLLQIKLSLKIKSIEYGRNNGF